MPYTSTGSPAPVCNDIAGRPPILISQCSDSKSANRLHLFISRIHSADPAFDRLLRLVADDATGEVILTDAELNWLYHPYDGGAGIIVSGPDARDELRASHPTWLSEHPGGL